MLTDPFAKLHALPRLHALTRKSYVLKVFGMANSHKADLEESARLASMLF